MSINKNQLLRLSKIAGSTFFIQAFIQFVGMLIGFYIVRQLSIEEYAYYTIANTMLGVMTIIADSGTNTTVYSEGAKVWQNREKLGAVLSTGIKFRKKLALMSLLISIPILAYMLNKQGANGWTIVFISLAIIPAFKAMLTDSLYEVIPKLHQDLRSLQKNQLLVAIFRLLLTGVLLIIFPVTWVVVLANGIPRIYGNFKLRKIVNRNADLFQPEDPLVKKEAIRIVKRVMPGTIYFAFSGQIALFILSYMGTTQDTAAWGAIGRFGVFFTIFSTVIAIILIPRYARLENERTKIIKSAHQILLMTIFCSLVVLGTTFIFSDFLLMLLGKHYLHLNAELLLTMVNSFLGLLAGNALAFSIRRGWVIHPIIDLAINIIPLIIFAWIIPLDSLFNIILFGTCCSLFNFIGHYSVFWIQVLNKTQ